MKVYSKDEIDQAVFMLKSMLNQIKLLNNLDQNESDDIIKMQEFVDNKIGRNLKNYYISMAESLTGNNKQRNNRRSSSKGRIGGLGQNYGPSSSSFK